MKVKEKMLVFMLEEYRVLTVLDLKRIKKVEFLRQDFFQKDGKSYIRCVIDEKELVLLDISNANLCIKMIQKTEYVVLELVIPKLDLSYNAFSNEYSIIDTINTNLTVEGVII